MVPPASSLRLHCGSPFSNFQLIRGGQCWTAMLSLSPLRGAERVGSLKETVNSPASPFHELGLQAHATMLGFALC